MKSFLFPFVLNLMTIVSMFLLLTAILLRRFLLKCIQWFKNDFLYVLLPSGMQLKTSLQYLYMEVGR